MIIKKLTIKSFGKLKNKEISFEKGINIVYGENERGKSTALAFIRAMLYGFPSTRSKDIKSNDRLRYLPWSGEKAAGEILISHEGRDIIISRTFGTGKREDTVEVFDAITGKEIGQLKDYSPGNTLLSLSAENFDKTLNIKQLNTFIARSKEDDLLQRISNLQESGEEGVSFDKALIELQYQRKLITNNRRSGELNASEEELIRLHEEYRKALKLSNENVENNLELNRLLEKREELRRELSNLELYKRQMKKSKLSKEYGELMEYLRKSESLKASKHLVEQELNTPQGIIDQGFINTLREKYSSTFSLKQALMDRQQQIEESNRIYRQRIQELQENYTGFEDVQSDVEEKLMALGNERSSLLFSQRQGQEIKEELHSLKEELKGYEGAIGPFAELLGDNNNNDGFIQSYEEKLRELKARLEQGGDSQLKKHRRLWKGKLIMAGIPLIIALTCFLLIFFVSGLSQSLKIVGAMIGGIGLIFGLFSLYKLKALGSKIKELSAKEKEIELLNKEVEKIEEKLQDTMKRLSISSNEEFLLGYQKYSAVYPLIEVLKIKIEDREKSLQNKNFEEVDRMLSEKEAELRMLLSNTETEGPEEFLRKLKDYKKEKLECELLKRDIINKEASRNILSEEYDEKVVALRNMLSTIGIENIEFDSIPKELQRLMDRLQKFKELEGELKAIDTTYKALLKERDIEDLRKDIDLVQEAELKTSYKNEEEIDSAIKELNSEFLNNEKKIKDLENLLDNLFKDIRPVWLLEEEMDNTKNRINELNKRVKVLDIAIENLKESFGEIQKSFGPALNKEVGELLKKITQDKYQEVKVSEEYGLTLRNAEDNKLFGGEFLSSGAFDQAYLALRLAIIKLIFKNASLPVLLDDAFIQYDDIRLEKALETLESFSRNKQIIMFTCQKREGKLLKEGKTIAL